MCCIQLVHESVFVHRLNIARIHCLSMGDTPSPLPKVNFGMYTMKILLTLVSDRRSPVIILKIWIFIQKYSIYFDQNNQSDEFIIWHHSFILFYNIFWSLKYPNCSFCISFFFSSLCKLVPLGIAHVELNMYNMHLNACVCAKMHVNSST